MSALPYAEVTEDSYAERAAADFTLTEVGPGTAELRGPCPRCGTVIHVPVVSSTYKSFRLSRGARRSSPPPGERLEPVICTCADDHPGRPADKVGCGAFWLLRISTS
ncbi:hypothetical protein AB0H03_12660 [Streptomyces sparsogenes]|uniref:hypothetical protein n=1 Tax=Streptomyces sparsogenes TaxID=67365 RepID=UPI0033FC8900